MQLVFLVNFVTCLCHSLSFISEAELLYSTFPNYLTAR